jgi:lysozyme
MATLAQSALAALAGIAYHEGKVNRVYLDPVGIPTACVGHTGPDTTISMVGEHRSDAVCARLLERDTRAAQSAVSRCVRVTVTQSQYDALVSFTFNVGAAALCSSTLVRKMNAGDCRGATAEFPRWTKARGRVLPGLVKRRADEQLAFSLGCPR